MQRLHICIQMWQECTARLCQGRDIEGVWWPWCCNQPGSRGFKYLHRLNAAVSLVTWCCWMRIERGFVGTAVLKGFSEGKEEREVFNWLMFFSGNCVNCVSHMSWECHCLQRSCWFALNNLRIIHYGQTVWRAQELRGWCVYFPAAWCWLGCGSGVCVTTD